MNISGVNISEAARQTELSIDTIRYYDRLGILGAVTRTSAGARAFTEGDLGWLRILRCLRETGMTMADLRRFVAIDGDREPARRLELLENHRSAVLAKMERIRRELVVLDGKIGAYRNAAQRPVVDVDNDVMAVSER
ncbi:MerR family transcriptional regulator [Pseudonocardia sp. TRM90224]|uniref:MerR family transcriptional regulator n=1 Tax=Pseudonocardia sp. TRM90224 TaxID=2812678 RepID=UPI001E2AE9AE|nr:MerR family transcriptional regulator [Pseudonocardia sp. TRM90224]